MRIVPSACADSALPRVSSVFFASTPLWTAMHGQLLDVLWQIHDSGNTVHLVTCDSSLTSCAPNPSHSLLLCKSCVGFINRSNEKLLPPKTKISKLDLNSIDLGYIRQLDRVKSTEEMARVTWNDCPIGAYTLNQIADSNNDIAVITDANRQQAIELAKNAIKLYERFRQIMEDGNYAALYVWNGRRPSDSPALWAAKNLGRHYFNFGWNHGNSLRLLQSTESQSTAEAQIDFNNFKTKKYQHSKKYLATLGDLFFYHQKNRSPQLSYNETFSQNFTRDFKIPQNSGKGVLAVFPSTPSEFAHLPNHLRHTDIFQLIEQLASDSSISKDYTIIVRWHPNMSTSGKVTQEHIRKLIVKTPNLFHILPGDNFSSYSVLEKAEAVLTWGSTVGIEAVFYGKPSILGPGSSVVYSNIEGIYNPRSYAELKGLLSRSLSVANPEDARAYGAWMLSGNVPLRRLKIFSHLDANFDGKPLKDFLPTWFKALSWIRYVLRYKLLLKPSQKRHFNKS